MNLPISFRQFQESDLSFILPTWIKELHRTIPYNFIPNDIFFPYQKKLILNLISSSQVIICHIEDSPDDLVGYLVARPYNLTSIILHHAHVKGIFRRMGISKELLAELDPNYKTKNIVCSHYFHLFPKLRNKYNLIFDPTILENK